MKTRNQNIALKTPHRATYGAAATAGERLGRSYFASRARLSPEKRDPTACP
jgi:hypothetical protein